MKVDDFKFIFLDKTDSTNEYAKRLVQNGEKQNSFILAETQSKGKTTKKDKVWYSPKGNMFLTITLSIKQEKDFPSLSFISGLSVAQCVDKIKNTSDTLSIKWPNDILFNMQKICGILIEKEDDVAIIGIGLNVKTSPEKNLTVYPTTSLKENNIDIEAKDIAIEILHNLVNNINTFEQSGFEEIINLIKPFIFNLNKKIYIRFNNELFEGIFSGIKDNGGLILTMPNGEIKTFISGELSKENFV